MKYILNVYGRLRMSNIRYASVTVLELHVLVVNAYRCNWMW